MSVSPAGRPADVTQILYAIVVFAVIAMLLPGVDPVTTLIEMVPMLFLHEFSILLASWVARVDRAHGDDPALPDEDPPGS
jgi:sec-independent protein translocase protein TatC